MKNENHVSIKRKHLVSVDTSVPSFIDCTVWSPDREFSGVDATVQDVDTPISCDAPALEETRRAGNQLKNGKAPGVCGIYAEMVKAGEPPPSCGCTLCCVPSGLRGSCRPTGHGGCCSNLLRERVTLRIVTTTEWILSSLC